MSEPKVDASTQACPIPQDVTSSPETRHSSSSNTVVDSGSRLGPYQMLEKLGEGAMGTIYKARHTRLDRLVALKVLRQHVLSKPDALVRFEREMKAVGKLHHPNIVQALDAGEYGGVHYLSMEYAEGQDLNVLIKTRGTMSIVDACKAIREAALGLAAAHRLGLVHRDIKPSNLFLTSDTKQIKILDLGLALLSEEEAPDTLTWTGQCFGTPDYMAPEQWNDAHLCDARTDLYALGCTLFMLLVGRAPYSGDEYGDVKKKQVAHLNGAIPDLAQLRPDTPAGLVAIYRKLMAKPPEERFASADELAKSLRPFVIDDNAPTLDGGFSLTTGSEAEIGTLDQIAPLVGLTSSFDRSTLMEGGPPATVNRLDATSVWTPGESGDSSGRNGRIPPQGTGGKRWLAAAGAGALMLLAGIIITITRKDGTTTTVKVPVPESSKVEIVTDDPLAVTTGWHGWSVEAPPAAIAPFPAEKAREHQEAWARYLKIPVESTNSLGMKFRLVPPGEFLLGSPQEEIDELLTQQSGSEWQNKILREGPQHRVALTQPIYVGMFEVTQDHFNQIMGTPPAQNTVSQPADAERPDNTSALSDRLVYPVHDISWLSAIEFCNTLSVKEGLQPRYVRTGESVTVVDGNGYRLPTEAEWEYACRAGTTTRWYSADSPEGLTAFAWFFDNSQGGSHPVGQLQANAFGLYDMHGNVWEFCQDFYGNYSGASTAVDPTGPSHGEYRVIRGASWYDNFEGSRCANRGLLWQASVLKNVGFRVVKTARPTVRIAIPANPPDLPGTTTADRNPAE